MTRGKSLHPEDRELFLREFADATPLKAKPRAHLQRERPAPVPVQTRRDEILVLNALLSPPTDDEAGLETGEELRYLREGMGSDVLRKLRRGEWVLQGELDLHGLTRTEAHSAVGEFLARALKRGVRCVRIIHGKGLRSKNREPVLKSQLGRWLARKDEVLAYCQARRPDGGSGAVVVLLRAGLPGAAGNLESSGQRRR
jgi:DNA-nicking Smr family endonuclease